MIKTSQTNRRHLLLIWGPILSLIGLVIALCLILYYQQKFIAAPLQNFDTMVVSEGFHKISLPSGQQFKLSYELNHDRVFDGIVRHINRNHESEFPIISFDILVTSGDFASPALVSADVENHHFSWQSLTSSNPQGAINLLHTIPMNQKIETDLSLIKEGDHIIVQGWDILKIDGYDKNGNYIGYWVDSGCNTTLITDVKIQ